MAIDESFTDLIRRACDRDEEAAAELVRQFEPELRRIIRFQMSDPGLRRMLDSLDVCQSVLAAFFAQLYAGNLQFSQPRQLAGLLALMARNKVVDRARQDRSASRGGGKVRAAVDGLEELVPDSIPEPDRLVADRDLLQSVRSRLDTTDQEILDKWLLGQEWAEIAKQMGSTPDALRKRLSRAIDGAARKLGLLEG